MLSSIWNCQWSAIGSESDSTDEPVVGNVNKFAVVPPGYTGRPKKGHLIFDACFECGKYIFLLKHNLQIQLSALNY